VLEDALALALAGEAVFEEVAEAEVEEAAAELEEEVKVALLESRVPQVELMSVAQAS